MQLGKQFWPPGRRLDSALWQLTHRKDGMVFTVQIILTGNSAKTRDEKAIAGVVRY
jgi:hypothetical protein